jgi:hypothetical protein
MKHVLILILRRVVGAIAGFFSGAIISLVAIIVAMIVCRSTFGLQNIRSPVFSAAILGGMIGFCLPKAAARDFEPWLSIVEAI